MAQIWDYGRPFMPRRRSKRAITAITSVFAVTALLMGLMPAAFASGALDVTVYVQDKNYDGGTTATISTCVVDPTNLDGSDTASCDLGASSASFATKDVGASKTVNASITLSFGGGNAGGPYTLGTVTAMPAAINAGPTVDVTVQIANKTYDGDTTATVTGCTADQTNVIGSDTVTCNAAGITLADFADANVGTGKTVSITTGAAALSGAEGGNYTLGTVTVDDADITAESVDVTVQISNKTYDGDTTATVSGCTADQTNVVSPEVVTCDASGITLADFADANVGTGKTVSITTGAAALSGAGASNYTLGAVTVDDADITAGPTVDVTVQISNKTYDGDTTATVTGCTADQTNVIGSDTVTCNAAGITLADFADANVGTGKTVSITTGAAALSGAEGGNYTLGTVTVDDADITAGPTVDVTVQISNKTYDGTTTATVTGCTADQTNVISGDTVTCDASGITLADFADANVGSGKTVSITTGAAALSGAEGGNYTLGTVTVDDADITPAPSSIAFTGNSYTSSGSTVKLEATVQSACKAGADITFDIDLDLDGYDDGSYSATANSAGVATYNASFPVGTIADVRVSVAPGNCDYAEGYGVIIVAGSGDASNGGGAYNNPGRINFGYTLQAKYDKRTMTTTVSGRILWASPGKVRATGRVTGYTKVDAANCPHAVGSGSAPSGICALVTGSMTVYEWDDVDLEWDLAATNVAFRLYVVDGGTATTCLKKSGSCTTNLKSDWFAMSISSDAYYGESTDLYPIKGGNIVVK